jgi:hypothetical protein
VGSHEMHTTPASAGAQTATDDRRP